MIIASRDVSAGLPVSWLPEGCAVRNDWADQEWLKRGACIVGPPARLALICASLGFKNPCYRGGIYLSAVKIRELMEKKP
jgi:hypothetical protein